MSLGEGTFWARTSLNCLMCEFVTYSLARRNVLSMRVISSG